MKPSDIINNQFEEIAEHYIIPTAIEPILRNALTVREDIEDSYCESEKEEIPYLRLKKSIDLHIAGILSCCYTK